MGASAGGLNALTQALQPLKGEFPAIIVIQHLHPAHKSHLADVLSHKTGKPVVQAKQGVELRAGIIYVAPPGSHLTVFQKRIGLEQSKLIRFSRPSIDRTFESVAQTYGPRAIGVILSGANPDGADGIRAIHLAGGTTLAQKPSTAQSPRMPQSAIDTGEVDLVLPITEMAGVLMELSRQMWHTQH
jgi:two-component system, chemotaxis family, protein-glutamate methylesterase/glutaminase